MNPANLLLKGTTKVCQLTGTEDRDGSGRLTGAELSGVTGGITGTDMGFSFEYNDKLYFLFGDSREFPPDLAEPQFCGTEADPIAVIEPDPEKVQRWRTAAEWHAFTLAHGDGYDSIATAPLHFNPDNGIPITFETSETGLVFGHRIFTRLVGDPFQFTTTQRVAANPQDKWVLVMGKKLLVITNDGRVFQHNVTGKIVKDAFELTSIQKVAANPQDKWVLVMNNRILVITNVGSVFVHEINNRGVSKAVELKTLQPVAAHPQDKWVLVIDNRILVITSNGRVYAHEIVNDVVGFALRLATVKKVASNPQDKWVLALEGRILVVTKDGRVFAHLVTRDSVGDPFQLAGPRVAENPRDKRVLVMDKQLLVLTGPDGIFRPTLLNGKPVARKEGAFSAFTDGHTIYAFFSVRAKLPGCTTQEGCAHDDLQPGGQTVLSRSSDGGRNFEEIAVVSQVKFLWVFALVEPAANLSGLPAELNGQIVHMWGSGRKNNDIGILTKWNRSYPFLAVAALSQMGIPGGSVFAHVVEKEQRIIAKAVGLKTDIKVASNPPDKWVLVMGNKILVIITDGRVFAHDVEGDVIYSPVLLPADQKVAANPQDKWVLVMGNRIIVITSDGSVWAHDIDNSGVSKAFRLNTAQKVAANPQDKWVLAMDNRILVITSDGSVFAHIVDDRDVSVAHKLGSSQRVAANPQDKWVLTMGNRIMVITTDGRVFAHDIEEGFISKAFEFTSAQSVAANAEDKHVLVMDSRILVITKQRWYYYAGIGTNNQPIWKDEESAAAPLPSFGSPVKSEGFHECLGYYSVRFIEGWQKWVMLYTCGGNDPKDGLNADNGSRGIYLRTADAPWGLWSDPFFIFDPGEAYCRFMHHQGSDEDSFCNGKGLNPAEESVRDNLDPRKRAWAGEYAPLLLPSRYQKADSVSVILYFLMSTWNPYQIVLMRTEVQINP